QNWQHYRQFMPDGMQSLFAGQYFWKFPPDFKMVVGPTHDYPPPAEYLKNTEKYSGQVKIVDLPNGEHTVTGHVAGIPLPHPEEPMKGSRSWPTSGGITPPTSSAATTNLYWSTAFWPRTRKRYCWSVGALAVSATQPSPSTTHEPRASSLLNISRS